MLGFYDVIHVNNIIASHLHHASRFRYGSGGKNERAAAGGMRTQGEFAQVSSFLFLVILLSLVSMLKEHGHWLVAQHYH